MPGLRSSEWRKCLHSYGASIVLLKDLCAQIREPARQGQGDVRELEQPYDPHRSVERLPCRNTRDGASININIPAARGGFGVDVEHGRRGRRAWTGEEAPERVGGAGHAGLGEQLPVLAAQPGPCDEDDPVDLGARHEDDRVSVQVCVMYWPISSRVRVLLSVVCLCPACR